jgi:hypothetical protein
MLPWKNMFGTLLQFSSHLPGVNNRRNFAQSGHPGSELGPGRFDPIELDFFQHVKTINHE